MVVVLLDFGYDFGEALEVICKYGSDHLLIKKIHISLLALLYHAHSADLILIEAKLINCNVYVNFLQGRRIGLLFINLQRVMG